MSDPSVPLAAFDMLNGRYGYALSRLNELEDLRRIGDNLQSEASRLAEAVQNNAGDVRLPYEARMALAAIRDLVGEWTDVRMEHGGRA